MKMAHEKVFFTHPMSSFIIDDLENTVQQPHMVATIEALADGHGPYVTAAIVQDGRLVHEDLVVTRKANGGDLPNCLWAYPTSSARRTHGLFAVGLVDFHRLAPRSHVRWLHLHRRGGSSHGHYSGPGDNR